MLPRLAVLLAGFAIFGAACSAGGSVTTQVLPSSTLGTLSATPTASSDPNEQVVFGSGAIPDTMPADIPIPAEASIGSTLIDRSRDRSEMILRVPVGVEALAAFFEANLPNRGYSIDTTGGDADSWEVAFTKDDVTGTITITTTGTTGGTDISQAVVVTTTADG